MIEIKSWTEHFIRVLEETFGERLWFAGLQGSRGRGEETEGSDIDLVVILDRLTPADVRTYERMLDRLPDRELVCGFLSGKEELLRWEPSDLFQFYYDTRPIVGSLDELLERIDDEAVRRAIKISVCNILPRLRPQYALRQAGGDPEGAVQVGVLCNTGHLLQADRKIYEKTERSA